MNGPLKDVLPKILDQQARVWSYEEDFNKLWSLLDGNGLDLTVKHIILWSHTPPGNCHPVNTDPFVSPIVWAVCAASRAGALQSLRITIVDLASAVDAEALLRRQIAVLKEKSIPWLKIVPWTELLKNDIPAISEALLNRPDGGSLAQPTGDDALNQLRQTLELKLTNPGEPDDRHAISNLVGPVILLGGLPTALKSQRGRVGTTVANHLAAINRVLEVCGLVRKRERAMPGDFQNDLPSSRRCILPPKTRVVLLDDQWHQGWGEWVCRALGTEFSPPSGLSASPQKVSVGSDVEVFVAHDPTWLIDRLTLAVDEADKRLRLSLLDPLDNCSDILLLDLRLFSGQLDRERAFVKKLLPLCEKFTQGRHAWPGLNQEELKIVNQWCDLTASSGAVAQARTLWTARSLLGRLVALTDFSLPIVLFSSTGDRDLILPLTSCGNIITSFSKPRTFGLSQLSGAEEFTRGFLESLQVAGQMLDGRRFLKDVLATSAAASEIANRFMTANGPDTSRWTYAELYVDESGSPVDYVGGYAVLYEDAEASPAGLYNALSDAGLIWGPSREEKLEDLVARIKGQRPTQDKADSLDNSSLEERVNITGQKLASNGPFAACVVNVPGNRQTLGLPGGPDLAYRGVAAALIELFLYDWLPVIAKVANTSLTAGIFVATRMWRSDLQTLIDSQWKYGCELSAFSSEPGRANADKVKLDDLTYDEQLKIGYPSLNRQRDGLVPVGSRGRKAPEDRRLVLAKTMDSSGAYEIVVGIARQRRQPAPVICTNGVKLSHGVREDRGDRPFLPRQIHYASDDLLGLLRRRSKWKKKEPPLLAPLQFGFFVMANEHLDDLLQASRAIDRPDGLPEAINLLQTLWEIQELRDVTRWVAARAAHRLGTMHGRDFVEVSQLRPRNARGVIDAFRRLVPAVRSGQVQLKHVVVENGQATVAVSSVPGVNWFKACVGEKFEVIRRVSRELNLEIRMVPLSRSAE